MICFGVNNDNVIIELYYMIKVCYIKVCYL